MLTLGFHSSKGGVGRTTAASIFAVRLAQRGKRVLLVDCDFEAPTLDIICRANPELGGEEGRGGFDQALREYTKTGAVDSNPAYLVDLGKRWKSSDWRRASSTTLPNPHHTFNVIDSVVDTKGRFVDESSKGSGALFLLPCSRNLGSSLTLDYSPRQTRRSLDRAVRDVVRAVGEAHSVDVAVLDMRNGLSDASALAGHYCHGIVTVMQRKYAHVLLHRQTVHWYWKTQRWGKPVFALFTLDHQIDKDSPDFWEFIKGKFVDVMSGVEMRQAWFQDERVALALGRVPWSQNLRHSDFFMDGYLDADVDSVLTPFERSAEALVGDLPDFASLQMSATT